MRGTLLFTVFLVMAVGGAQAQQMPAFSDSVVITATTEEQPADAVPAATTVIDGEEIAASGEVSIAELLRRVAGATLLRSGFDGGVTSLFVRGTSSTHTLVLFDGVRLNSPYFGGYDWSLPLTAGAGRIEVVRGPYSALYGADAIGGVVQLIPERGRKPGAAAFLEAGPDGWRRAEVEASARLGRLAAAFSAATRAGGGALENDDYSGQTALFDVSYALAGGGRIGLLGHWTESDTEVPFSGAIATPHQSTAAHETLVALPLRLPFRSGADLEVTLNHVERSLAYRNPDDQWGFFASDTQADSDGARALLHVPWGIQRLSAGGEWRRDEVTDASSYGLTLNAARVTTQSLFVQDAVRLGAAFDLLLGARWDEATPWGDELSPRAVVSWHSAGTRAWVSYGRAFRAPSLGELYYPGVGNPSLTPERSRAAEAGVSLTASDGALRLELVGFINRIDELVDFDYATYTYGNIARAAQDGVELSGAARLGGARWVSAAVTWLDTRDSEGQPLLRRAEWSGSATLAGPLFGAVAGEIAVVWVGTRDDIDPITFERGRQSSFVTLDAALRWPLADWLRVRVRGDNLADREYQEVRGYPAPGRRLFLGLETVLD